MSATRRLLIVAGLAAAGLVVAPPAARAQDGAGSTSEAPSAPVAVSMELSIIEPPLPDLPYRVAATVRDENGSPVAGATVRFGIETSLLGGRTAGLGEATTDASGIARVAVNPRTSQLTVSARLAGTPQYEPAETSTTLTFPEDAVVVGGPLNETRSLLAPVRDVMPGVMTALVVAIWVLLIGTAVHAVRHIRREGAREAAVRPSSPRPTANPQREEQRT